MKPPSYEPSRKDLENAEKLINFLKNQRDKESMTAWSEGGALYELYTSGSWRGIFDTWRELVDNIGISKPTEWERRTNYEFYIVELGFALDDENLLSASNAKLAIATKKEYRPTVARLIHEWREDPTPENDWLALCKPGMMSRQDLRKWLDEVKAGEEPVEPPRTVLREAFNALRKVRRMTFDMTEDELLVFWETLGQPGELNDFARYFTQNWQKFQQYHDSEVVVEDGFGDEDIATMA